MPPNDEDLILVDTQVKVLVVEDNAPDFMLLKAALQGINSHGFDITRTDTLKKAKEAVRKKHFDLIFVDLNLPDGFGISTVDEIHKSSPRSHIIVVTGIAGDLTVEEAKKAGAAELIVKAYLDEESLSWTLNSNGLLD